jgi:hypothetical protein
MQIYSNAYTQTIANCKAPKDPVKVKTILHCLITGCQREMSSEQIAARLNEINQPTLTGKEWTANNVQMAILHAVSADESRSLARGLAAMVRDGNATEADFHLLHARCTRQTLH